MASLAVDQLRVLPFLVAPSSLEGNAICACCSGRCHPICIENAPKSDVDGKLRTLIDWSPLARTSMARWSVAATATFMSRNFVLHRTVAPASLHTLAKVLSGPPARIRNLPE